MILVRKNVDIDAGMAILPICYGYPLGFTPLVASKLP